MKDADLLASFFALFEPLSEFMDPDDAPRCCKQTTNFANLEPLYERLPARFPRLYEKLVLSYRWEVSTIRQGYRVLANPPGHDFSGLIEQIYRDQGLADELLPNGLIQFASCEYDPICFHTESRSSRDSPIVRVDHEQILCNYRIKIVETVASSFRDFVQKLIDV